MKRPYFFCRTTEMWADSWTYGDWRQYVCNRPNGQTQCARISALPIYGLMLGVVLLSLVVFAAYVAIASRGEVHVRWWLVSLLVLGSAVLIAPSVVGRYRGIFLMKAVGPYNKGSKRVFSYEEDE